MGREGERRGEELREERNGGRKIGVRKRKKEKRKGKGKGGREGEGSPQIFLIVV